MDLTWSTTPTILSVADFQTAQTILDSGDRGGFYLFLAEKTGNPAYITTAEISTASGAVGGAASQINVQ
jgi:hypothetical protein